jgi:hypothetical protein
MKVVTEEKERGTVKKSFKDQDPRDIIGRCLTLERLRTIPVHLIEKLAERDKSFSPFLIGKTSKSVDAKGNPLTTAKINWEYALFDATQRDILNLFNNFTKVRKTDEA